METALKQTFASLGIRNYRIYFIGQGLSQAGTWMQTIALSWLVLQLTHSGTQLGLVIAVQFLPVLLLGVWGGLIADRFSKRKLLYITQSFAGLLSLILGLLVVTHTASIGIVYVLAGLAGLGRVIDNPTRQTFIMEMVGEKYVKNAVTLNSTMVNLARIVGPSLAGVVIATVGVGPCFLIDALSYAAVLFALTLMNKHELMPTKQVAKEPKQVRAGLAYVWHEPRLKATLAMMVVMGIFAYEFPVVLPLFATHTFHGGASTYAAMTAAMSVGAVVGGLYAAGRKAASQTYILQLAVWFGVSIVLVALMPNVVLAYVMLVCMGALSVQFISQGNSSLQLSSDPSMRGRVMALWSMAFLGTTPIGGPIIGFVADHATPRIGLLVGGLSCFVAAAIGWWILRHTNRSATVAGEKGMTAEDTTVAMNS